MSARAQTVKIKVGPHRVGQIWLDLSRPILDRSFLSPIKPISRYDLAEQSSISRYRRQRAAADSRSARYQFKKWLDGWWRQ